MRPDIPRLSPTAAFRQSPELCGWLARRSVTIHTAPVAFFNAVGSLAKDLDNIHDDKDLEDAISGQETSISRSLQALSAKIASHRLVLKTGLMSVTVPVPAIVRSIGISSPIALVGGATIAAGAIVWKHFQDVRSARLESSWSYLLTLGDEFRGLSNGEHFLGLGFGR
jgi:hypothetical protein